MEIALLLQILLEIKKKEVASSTRHKEILNKHLCKNLFEENRMPVFSGDSNIEEGDQ